MNWHWLHHSWSDWGPVTQEIWEAVSIHFNTKREYARSVQSRKCSVCGYIQHRYLS